MAAASAVNTAATSSLAADTFGNEPPADSCGRDAPGAAFCKVLQLIGDNAGCQIDIFIKHVTYVHEACCIFSCSMLHIYNKHVTYFHKACYMNAG